MIQSHSNATSSRLDRGLFYALLAFVVWVPLPLGSNRIWAWSLMEVWVFIMFALWCWGYARGQLYIPPLIYKARTALLLLLAWMLLLTLQITPLPSSIIAVLSPEAARMHGLAQAFSGQEAWMTLSVDPASTRAYWLKSLAYVLLFILILLLVRQRQRLRLLATVLVFSGVFQAVYGSFLTLSGLDHLFVQSGNPAVTSGTFINRNHLAGYLEMCLAAGTGLLIAGLEGGTTRFWRQRLRNVLKFIFSPKMRLRIYLAIMVIALVLTHSRMGNTAFFASMMIAGVIGLMLTRHATRSTVILLVSLVIIDIMIIGTWFGIEKVVQRIEQTSIDKEERVEVDIYTLELIKDYPVFGAGGGSFSTAFPRYRGGDIKVFHDHALNDYLQFATESGGLGLTILGLFVLSIILQALKALRQRRDPLYIGIAFAVIMGTSAILIHGTVDFNLQIPANAATFMLLQAFASLALHLQRANT
ncbi:O-antigen ligase family protein [Sulfuriflexus mobilis]|uniref:O-antigen ligase family protein n=1 Tax=Sulfuriflexus mobilis TaxID=1811807 RepID=UPI000F842EDE|nr:O-antigen ligase family protein [Sulfuriflexus mobilis]